jgi:pantoate--beta-alanine ligase
MAKNVKDILVIDDPQEMQRHSDRLRAMGKTIAFVPTMGYLHEGHLSLCHLGLEKADELVLSIFVNPTQFGANEDLDKYPRDWDRDLALAAQADVDTIYAPTGDKMYPDGFETIVRVEKTSSVLCGASRPVHFGGVALVCCKLFNAVKPNYAIFGAKDYQQYLVVKKMVRDLNMDLEVIPGAIFRESDGLAMSSRNVYMTPAERAQAPVLRQSLDLAEQMVADGERNSAAILKAVRNKIETADLGKIDYIELRTVPDLLEIKGDLLGTSLLALACGFGKSRLIDNTVLLGHKD